MKLFKKAKYLIVAFVAAMLAVGASALATTGPTPPGGATIQSDLGVLNKSAGQVNYVDSVNGKVDDTINIQVWYHNKELEDSGKVADNVRVRVTIPGTKQTNHTISSYVKGTNTNYVTDTASVHSSIPTNLRFIPGSAIRRYNSGTNANPHWVTQAVPDSVVGDGYTVPHVKPCWNFQESITLQAKLSAPVISIIKQVKVEGSSTWVTNTQASPGDTLAYLITVKNEGNTQLNNVIIRDSLPPRITLVPGSVKLYNANHRDGITMSDNLINGGINTGNYTVGSDVKVRFQATVPAADRSCNMTFTNVGITRSDEVGEYHNNAVTTVPCQPLEGVRIRIVKFNDINGSRAQESNEPNLSGWQFKVTGPGTDETVTTDESGTALLTSLEPGRYTVTEINQEGWENTTGLVIVRDVTVDESTQTFTFGNRTLGENPPTTPGGGETTLPVSGPEDALPIAGAMTMSGGILAWIRSKKQLISALRK